MSDVRAIATIRAAFELSPTILSISDLEEGRLLEVNDAFLRITGFSREDVIGRRIDEIGFWVDPSQRRNGLDVLRAGGSVRDLESRFRTKTGVEVVTLANADLVDVDGRTCVITSLMDITDRVRAETALRESEQRFAQFFHANPLPMWIVRLSNGRHLDVNEAAVRHSGYTRDEMLGHTNGELGFWADTAERDRMLDLLRRDGRVRDFEVLFRTKGGDERRLLVNSEVITHGGEPAVLSVSLDITERAEAARAKDEFLAMLGHELRNPLATITTALGVLDRFANEAPLRRLAEVIGRQTTQLTRLVDDLLDVARLTSGKIEVRLATVDLRVVAGRVLDALRDAGRVADHDVTLEGESVWVHGDPARLEQVMHNVVDNALKYTPAGGRVRVATGRTETDAVVTVRDSGEGIRPELLDRVFELFVQQPQALDRSRGGLGLGLTLVKRLVQLHGGTVVASSAGPGHGSEFTIRLPVVPPPVDQGAATPAPAVVPSAQRRRVLIVEDNADARESLRLLLEMVGHEVETSEDAPAALAKLRAFRPDVALVDIGLPGVDGYAFARLVRQDAGVSGVRLIALTGYGQAEDQKKAIAAGFDLHVTKPVDPARLARYLV